MQLIPVMTDMAVKAMEATFTTTLTGQSISTMEKVSGSIHCPTDTQPSLRESDRSC